MSSLNNKMIYNRKLLDRISLEMIKEGKDIRYDLNGKLYTIDIREYEELLRFEKPELFKEYDKEKK